MMSGLSRSALLGFALLVSLPAYAQQAPGVGMNYETRLSNLEDQLRAMNGRIEQLEFSVRRHDQAMQRLQADVDSRLARLETRAEAPAAMTQVPAPMPPPAPSANNFAPTTAPSAYAPPQAEQPAPIAPINGSLGSLKMQDGRVTGGSVNPQAPPLPATPADYGLTPQEQYDRAFDLLRQADYEEAGTAFEAFINKNPGDKLIDNAKYWYGETLYVRGKFDTAAVAFADSYQQNPQGTKAADSLLKLAMSLEGIGKIPDACTTLESLKSKYPNASVSIRSRADQERTKLKCSSLGANSGGASTTH